MSDMASASRSDCQFGQSADLIAEPRVRDEVRHTSQQLDAARQVLDAMMQGFQANSANSAHLADESCALNARTGEISQVLAVIGGRNFRPDRPAGAQRRHQKPPVPAKPDVSFASGSRRSARLGGAHTNHGESHPGHRDQAHQWHRRRAVGSMADSSRQAEQLNADSRGRAVQHQRHGRANPPGLVQWWIKLPTRATSIRDATGHMSGQMDVDQTTRWAYVRQNTCAPPWANRR